MKKTKWLVVLLILFASFITNALAADKGQDKILAQVGKYKLTLKEFNDQIRSLPPQLQMAVQRNPELKKQLLDRWVQLNLMALEARKQKLQDKPDVKKRIEEMTNALLAQEYMMENVSDKAKVTDKEIKEYYDKHKSEFMQPEQVRARHILIKVPANATKKQWEEARKKALEIRAKLLKGESFAKLAQKYSDDPGSKTRGGDLGYFRKGQMVPEFEKAAFALKKGEISQPVKTTFGYHIIKLEDKKPAKQRSFQEVKQEIRQKLLRQKQMELRNKIVEKLRKKYPVSVHEELLNAGATASGGSMPH
ncbi:MAG: peptidylprolyl isomerase [Thermodesulfobacteria bacterium]|nr:peptidylprolyl isomerase [Thermodesulfobacteriota bacterium]